MYRTILFLCTLFVCIGIGAGTGIRAQDLQTRVVVDGRDIPWEIIWGPDGWIWMTEISGTVSRLNPETGEVVELITISDVKQIGEGGLLGMALHPDFPATPQVFLAYNYDDNGATRERIVRYEYNGTALINPVTLLTGIQGANIHNGCRLLFGPDKTLLITTGDAANQTLPQDHTSLNGKILRINPDGTIPSNNPWPGSPVFTTGHRNAQGLVFGQNNRLYSSEHGPSTDDEVNVIVIGENYGWPNVHGYCDRPQEQEFCEDSSVVEPIAAWTPTIAVCGLDYYNHNAIPEWSNSLLMATLKASKLVQLKLSADGRSVVEQKDYFAGQFGRLRDICIAPDGRVFVSTSNGSNNKVIEIKSTSQPPAQLSFSTEILNFGRLLLSQTDTTISIGLTNTGGRTIVVNEYSISGSDPSSFSVPGFAQFTLEPNQQQAINVRFNPDGAGTKSANFLVRGTPTGGGTVETTIPLTGRKSLADVSATSTLDFGIVEVGEVVQRPITITNTGQESLVLNQLSIDQPQPFSVLSPTEMPVTIPIGAQQEVIVQIAPTQLGAYQSILTASFGDDISATTQISAVVTTASTGVHEAEVEYSLQIAPNPATAGIEVRVSVPGRGMATLSIVDYTGRVVFRKEIAINTEQLSVFWNGRTNGGASCPAGLYTAVVAINGVHYTAPVVLVR